MIGIVSQARMTSSRLPGKILKQVKGKTLLDYHVRRLRWSGYPVFIATTTNQQDDVVIDFCNQNEVGYFRGDENNVLSRYYFLAKKFNLKTIVRVTSDCPLIDGKLIKKALEQYAALPLSSFNYLTNCQKRTYPRGFDFEVFSFESLEKMYNEASLDYEKEHVTPFIWKSHPEQFNIQHFTREGDASGYRITVDELDDFKLIETLILQYSCDTKDSEEIIDTLKNNPELTLINKHIEQKKV